MIRRKMPTMTMLGVLSVLVMGCVGAPNPQKDQPLSPPAYADPVAATAIQEGNRLFSLWDLRGASKHYEAAIQAQSSLGEAHYNLGLALHQQGRFVESHPHFRRAAKLEPGNLVIRNAPPFRTYGTVEQDTEPESFDGHSGHRH